jgi:hypothetical protein
VTLEQVAFDIETTGFGVGDEVTVVGFALPLGVQVFVQTGGREPTRDVAAAVQASVEACCEREVVTRVAVHASEAALLDAVAGFVGGRLANADRLLVAYNGETWNGGFDVPFLRTRYALTDAPWPFVDVPYADLYPVVTRRFNTTVTVDAAPEAETTAEADAGARPSDGDSAGGRDDGSGERRALPDVYDVLCGGQFGAIDPFDESAAAVTAFDAAQFTELVRHNVADVLRTQSLGRVAERYCNESEFDVKRLTPTREV